jgi:hypothetical protein
MLYELRIYTAVPGKLPQVNDRFRNHTLKLFEKHGIKSVGYWTYMLGPSNNQLVYVLAWKDLAERERLWAAFGSDPEWLAVRKETEKDGPIVDRVENSILQPTDYSPMK